jgi:hypothetical protein
MRNHGITIATAERTEGPAYGEKCLAPVERVVGLDTCALFDWGMGLGATLHFGRPSRSDRPGRDPSS